MRIVCGHCGRMVDLGDRTPGERLPCPVCSAPVTVPSLDGLDAPRGSDGSPDDTHVLDVEADFAEQARQAMSQTRTVKVACGGCGKGLSVGARLSGRKVRCPNCRKTLRVPYPDDDEDDFHDLDVETAVHGEEDSLDLTGQGPHPRTEARSTVGDRPRRTASGRKGHRTPTSRATRRPRPGPSPSPEPEQDPERYVHTPPGGLSNRSLAALCALGVVVMLTVLSAPVWLRYIRQASAPTTPAPGSGSAVEAGAGEAGSPDAPGDPAEARERSPVADALDDPRRGANEPTPSDLNPDPGDQGPARRGAGLAASAERIELDAFATGGRHPARPGYLYWRVTVRLEAAGKAITLSSAGPDAVLVSMGMRIESLGSPDDGSLLPARARGREVSVRPGSPTSATFVFEVPQEFTRARLVLAGGGEVLLRVGRVRTDVPARRLAGQYVEALPRNLPPLADEPILAALRDAPGELAVAARGEDLALRFTASGVEGLARPAGRGGGVYEVGLGRGRRSLRAKLRVLPDGGGLVLFLDDSPYHQLTYRRADAPGRGVRVIVPKGDGLAPPPGSDSAPGSTQAGQEEPWTETVEPEHIEPPRFFDD